MKNLLFHAIDKNKITKQVISIGTEKVSKYKKKKKKKHKKIKQKKVKHKKRHIIKSYKVYIKSKLWVKRKNRYFQKYGKKCQGCGNKNYVTLHHKIYRQNYGDEPDDEVVALCYFCHNLYHDTYGVQKDMIEKSNSFLKDVRGVRVMMKEIEEQESFIRNIT